MIFNHCDMTLACHGWSATVPQDFGEGHLLVGQLGDWSLVPCQWLKKTDGVL